jgi:hypothetical protein
MFQTKSVAPVISSRSFPISEQKRKLMLSKFQLNPRRLETNCNWLPQNVNENPKSRHDRAYIIRPNTKGPCLPTVRRAIFRVASQNRSGIWLNDTPHDGVWQRGAAHDSGGAMAEETLVLACCDPAAGLLAS